MLKITSEIYPYGYTEGKHTIRELYIANMATRNAKNQTLYHVWLSDPRDISPRPKPVCKVWHLRNDGDLILVGKASNKLGKMLQKPEQDQNLTDALSAWSKAHSK